MSLPGFQTVGLCQPEILRSMIADRIRVERRRMVLSQKAFAEKCGIPLRTFKRVEQGECDSLDAFLRVVIAFERIIALELLFPPPSSAPSLRSPLATLNRLKQRVAGCT